MAKLATDILAIQDMLNSFKNTNINIEDIFKIINKNKGIFLDNSFISNSLDFPTQDEMLDINELEGFDGIDEIKIDIKKSKKGKRYLN